MDKNKMRPIKFRQPLWGKHSEFVDWHYWGFIDDIFIEPAETPYSSLKEAKEQSQQFTGLHDKNGQEIWEGDIVKWKNQIAKKEYQGSIWAVIWDKVYAKFTVKYKGGGKSSDSIFPLFTETSLEIIGDVHQNIELIEETK